MEQKKFVMRWAGCPVGLRTQTSNLRPPTSHLTPHTSHLTPCWSCFLASWSHFLTGWSRFLSSWSLTPRTSHFTPRTSHLTSRTSHLIAHTNHSHLTSHTRYLATCPAASRTASLVTPPSSLNLPWSRTPYSARCGAEDCGGIANTPCHWIAAECYTQDRTSEPTSQSTFDCTTNSINHIRVDCFRLHLVA